MRHTLKRSLGLLAALSVLVCSSCASAAQEERSELYTGEYFKDSTPSEHWYYIFDTFITLLPHLKSPEELGVSNVQYSFGNNGEPNTGTEYDKLISNGGANIMKLKAIPIFYGLLKETQKYEEQMGVDNSEVAQKHGKRFAVSAKSVEDFYCMLLRHAASVQHGSADGAEHVDGYYVFDELVNPYQDWLDKGWELYIMPDPVLEDQVDEWGKCAYFNPYCTALWYDKEGNIYNVYGELFAKQENPSHRLSHSEYMDIRNKNAIGTIVFGSSVSLAAKLGGNTVQLNSPLESISFGTVGGSNAGVG